MRHEGVRQERGVVVVDLNRDGLPDVALLDTHGERLVVFIHVAGELPRQYQSISLSPTPSDLIAADLTATGTPDLVVMHGCHRQITYLPGRGTGSFHDPQRVELPSAVRTIVPADIDGDGVLELLVVSGATVDVFTARHSDPPQLVRADGGPSHILDSGRDVGLEPVAVGAATDPRETLTIRQVLTPRELEVAEMVSVGLTAREIGERLFIGRRTVETHIARIYNKLGIDSRVELAHHVIVGGGRQIQ